jgi:hypothetical protein
MPRISIAEKMPDEKSASDVVRVVLAPPDKSVASVLLNATYPLPNAIAELVDNSLDANASNIVIRLRRTAERATGIQVIDDGKGISEERFTDIMKMAWKSPHKPTDIGMFGVGLKTATLSQAAKMNVYSKVRDKSPHGRQWLRSNLNSNELHILRDEVVLARYQSVVKTSKFASIARHGTIVEMEQLPEFERSVGNSEKFLRDSLLDLEGHLGLIFHRFVEKKGVELHLEVEEAGEIVEHRRINPINPFRYPRAGARGWPKQFEIRIPSTTDPKSHTTLTATAHIWPPRTQLPEYHIRRIGGRTSLMESQGFYFYVNDRLVQAGGWSNVRTPEHHISLARMAIDLTPEAQRIVEITYTKDAIKTPASFIEATRESRAACGTTFSQWIEKAQEVFRTPPPDQETRLPALPVPGDWIRKSVRDVLGKSQFPRGEEVGVVWQRLGTETVFKIDRDRKRIIINSAIRTQIERVLGSSNRLELFEFMLLMSLREHFGERSTKKLTKFEALLNRSLLEYLK